jgi:hypothetical protein
MQNIEYTQYMPGSKHTLDRGQHLGSDRIAERIAGVGVPMADPTAAGGFYTDKLSFKRGARPLEAGLTALTLPGSPSQEVEILPASVGGVTNTLPFHLIFSVSDLRRTEERLRWLGLTAKKHAKTLVIDDPDGDLIVFAATKE